MSNKNTCGECDLYNVDFGFCAWDMKSHTENDICDNGEFIQTEEEAEKALEKVKETLLNFQKEIE